MRRPARFLLAAVGLLLAVGLAAAWLLPPRLDWSRYRGAIATLASERLGREVSIAGPVSLRVLPEPVLMADGVSLADAGDGIAIRAAQLRLRVALGALVRGRIDARELVLHGVDMHVPWPFQPIRIAAGAPGWFAVASVSVEDSRLSIGHLSFSGIAATLTTDVLTGSYAAAGVVQFSGRTWQFTTRLSGPGQDGTAGLDLSLDGRGTVQGVGATLSGQIQADGRFGGRLTGRGPDLSQLVAAPQVPFTLHGRVSAAGGLATVDELSGEIGGEPVKGAVAVRVLPAVRADIALSTGRLNLDSWAPVLLRGGTTPFPLGIDFTAEAAELAGGTLRGLRGAFDAGAGGIAVRQLRAVLPGEATLGATGAIESRGGGPRFEGDVAISAPAAQRTLAWLEGASLVPPGVLPEDVLRNAELTAHATLEAGRLTLSGLNGRADATHLAGTLTFRTGPRPSLAAVLQADRVDLDPWLWASWPAPAALAQRLARLDTDLSLTASEVMLRGVRYGPLSLDAAVAGGRVSLRRLELAGDGLRLVASGTLDEAGRLTDGRLDIRAPSAGSLIGLLAPDFAPSCDSLPACQGAVSLSAQAAGPPGALGVHVLGDLADLRVEAQQTIDIGAGRSSGSLTLRHPGASRLAASLGLDSAPAWLGDGSLGLIAQLSLQLPGNGSGRIGVDSFDLSAGGLRANGRLALDGIGVGSVPSLTGRIAADTLPLPLPDPRASEPLAFGALKGWRADLRLQAAQLFPAALPMLRGVAARLLLADGKLAVEGFAAHLGDGVLAGSASVDATAAVPQVALQAELSGATLDEPLFEAPVDIASGKLDASAAVTASGHSPAALLSTLSGEARLAATDGTLVGVALGNAEGSLSDAAVKRALAGGTTAFSRLDLVVRAERGVLQVTEGRMVGPAGTAGLTGSVDLPGDAADLRLGLRPAVPDPPDIGLRLAGPLEQLRREPELAAAALWRAEHAAVPE
jgi:uncharacterized protein involved in outer membrane biogenesis